VWPDNSNSWPEICSSGSIDRIIDRNYFLKEHPMFRRCLSHLLVISLSLTTIGVVSASAKSKAEKEAERTAKVKAGIAKLGIGKDARVALKLRDKTKLSGYISQADEDSFAVTDVKTGAARTVAYSDVTQAQGKNLSTGAAIAIGIAIGVGATLLVLLIIISTLD
jgi:hypothetical protein